MSNSINSKRCALSPQACLPVQRGTAEGWEAYREALAAGHGAVPLVSSAPLPDAAAPAGVVLSLQPQQAIGKTGMKG